MSQPPQNLQGLASGGSQVMTPGAFGLAVIGGLGLLVLLTVVARVSTSADGDLGQTVQVLRSGVFDRCPQTLLPVPEPEGCSVGEYRVVPRQTLSEKQYEIVSYEGPEFEVGRVEAVLAAQGFFYRRGMGAVERRSLRSRIAFSFKEWSALRAAETGQR